MSLVSITCRPLRSRFSSGLPGHRAARRWEIELVFDEIKTHQRGRPVVRSHTPDGVRQEIYAHLIVHHATRDLLDEAARLHRSTAERTSFTRALHVVRRSVISPSGFSSLGPPSGPTPWTLRDRPQPAAPPKIP
ncbi:transposase [Streptomyces sp. NPDC088246]|uniref:transposase n=1 Tax=Streptomyces sp. NPDC088246 TaxID=3365842 RepID=UPI00382D2BD3